MSNFVNKIGLPSHLVWGYVGVMLFMVGDGLEIGWLSPYLVEQGLTVQQSAYLFTAYGVTIAISSWFSGTLFEALGAKKTMFLGVLLYVIGTIGFVGFAIENLNYPLMLVTYALRGFGYPLFAYGFLVWIAYRTPQKQLGAAVGWFWFVFTGGLNVIGAYYSIWAIENLGHINTLWSALLFIALGAFFALVINRDKIIRPEKKENESKLKELLKGITIIKKEPKVGIAGIVRIINQTGQYAFPVFIPTYFAIEYGISTSAWLSLWGTIFLSNIAVNLLSGMIGDRFGWRNTVMWFGGVGCAVFTVLFFYTPALTGGNLVAMQIVGILWGACIAGYVPLSALVPSLVKEDKGAAMAILNLGAGLCVFVGPLLVGIFFDVIGVAGLIWLIAGLHLVGAFLTKFITLPNNAKTSTVDEDVVAS
ncbi:MFS transporter [Shouchella sp. 1P09AA]|uniref:MFS transporter n=1 Tax=unclassified Shouchella TaxID=2893065 RepID=UPI0039A06EDD